MTSESQVEIENTGLLYTKALPLVFQSRTIINLMTITRISLIIFSNLAKYRPTFLKGHFFVLSKAAQEYNQRSLIILPTNPR